MGPITYVVGLHAKRIQPRLVNQDFSKQNYSFLRHARPGLEVSLLLLGSLPCVEKRMIVFVLLTYGLSSSQIR